MSTPLPTVTLTGRHVRLEPMQSAHVDELAAAAAGDRSTFDHTHVPDGADATARYVAQLLDAHRRGSVLPFVQRSRSTGALVGCTRFMEPRWWRGRPEPDEIEIGGTWLTASAQRTGINTEAKLLLLGHAFDRFGVWRVAICTDARNERSRGAIERIGASFEGILRHHRPRHNSHPPTPRNSALYAITDDDWPAIRDHLTARLAAG